MFKDLQAAMTTARSGERVGGGGGWVMRGRTGEAGMSQGRQALLCLGEKSGFYSRYDGTSWRYKARMVDICCSFGCPVPNRPS